MSSQYTPGPWRWEFNAEHRSVHLVGGRPQFDLTIMDFSRWGMNGAGVNLRDTLVDGMNIMHKLQDRKDWIAPFLGRAHHAKWCADVVHPDMRLIAAAPELLEAAQSVERLIAIAVEQAGLFDAWRDRNEGARWDRLEEEKNSLLAANRAAIAKATGSDA